MKNIHAKLIAEYAKDWAETDTPWERWEHQLPGEPTWETLITHPVWAPYLVYRRKPRTININGYQVPEPLRSFPNTDEDVYIIDIMFGDSLTIHRCLGNSSVVRAAMKGGIIHSTREAAELHAMALLSFTTTETKTETEQQ